MSKDMLVCDAMSFARECHKGQMRKYGGREYIKHPQEVAALVSLMRDATDEEIAAAWLHDVVEDCAVPIGEIQRRFGDKVAAIVWDLTNEFTKSGYPQMKRTVRKVEEHRRICKLPDDSLRIKLIDRFCNLTDCLEFSDTPTDFRELQYNETYDLLERLEQRCMGSPKLEQLYVSLCFIHARLALLLDIVPRSSVV
jgi:(p)ppGpp synthase/HD superfamily hydrolase